MTRTEMREETFKVMYSLSNIKEKEVEEQIEIYLESNEINEEKTIKFIKETTNGIYANISVIDEEISKYLKDDWTIRRISKMDLAILRIAIYELKETSIPFKVIINEAVELSKKYAEEKSRKFVNGILASVVNGMENRG